MNKKKKRKQERDMSFLPEGIPLFSLVDLHYQKTIKKAEH